jgi:Protein of unknown function (DUF2934)
VIRDALPKLPITRQEGHMATKTATKSTIKPAITIATKPSSKSVTDELIAQIAYRLWEDDGQPHGRDQDHWHRAQEIAAAKATIAAKKTAAKKPAANKNAAPKKTLKKSA